MAGNENNSTILAADNQTVKAINDLATAIVSHLGDTIVDAVVAAVSALPQPKITVVSSGGGSCSSGCAPGGADLVDSTPSNGQTTTGDGPGGYNPPSSWGGTTEQYNAYKCKAATWIANNYIDYVNRFMVWTSIGTATPLMIGVFGQLPEAWLALLSPAMLFALAAELLTIAIAGELLAVYLETYKASLVSTKDQFICDLYNSTSVSAAKAVITAWVSDNMPAGLGAVSGIVDYHVNNLFPNNVVNTLFEHYSPVDDVTSGDCSACFDFWNWVPCHEEFVQGYDLGEIAAIAQCGTRNGSVYGLYPFFNVNHQLNNAYLIQDDSSYTVQVTIVSGSLVSPYQQTGYPIYYYTDQDGATLYQGDTFQPALACRGFQIYSLNPFTAHIVITPA